ncbi:hypothetical protein EKO27_g6101 [Xylaria grammica]|uniref:Uncharacterized protein n=1 Tax=Xylaria grammica TaxID=363999 RepID=A0A439D3M2_9PEZI|nr:hypothetical protein EKO27_g6101 [Xylaria grammica]
MGSISADSLDPLMSDQDNESGVQWAMKHQEGSGRRHIPRWRRITLAELLLIILISFTIVLISISLAFKPTDKQCARQLSVYSPAMDAVEYIEYDFDNAFGSQSIYRGPPTDEREAAWHALTALHGFEIPAHQLASLNRSTEGLRRVPEDIGTGFVGFLEVFHQLHCLNGGDICETNALLCSYSANERAEYSARAVRISELLANPSSRICTLARALNSIGRQYARPLTRAKPKVKSHANIRLGNGLGLPYHQPLNSLTVYYHFCSSNPNTMRHFSYLALFALGAQQVICAPVTLAENPVVANIQDRARVNPVAANIDPSKSDNVGVFINDDDVKRGVGVVVKPDNVAVVEKPDVAKRGVGVVVKPDNVGVVVKPDNIAVVEKPDVAKRGVGVVVKPDVGVVVKPDNVAVVEKPDAQSEA